MRDNISFMKFELKLDNRCNKLNFVEIGGEAFAQAYRTGLRGAAAWGELGAGTCLQVNNRKCLFFILDYSLAAGINQSSTETEQAQILTTALTILSTDGTGNNYSKNCTLSKVDTVAVIVTKSDLMGTDDRDERMKIANRYVAENFAAFMTALTKMCKNFGINSNAGYRPYIMPFSLGKFLIGNTYIYDPTDSEKIVEFISATTQGNNISIWDRLFG